MKAVKKIEAMLEEYYETFKHWSLAEHQTKGELLWRLLRKSKPCWKSTTRPLSIDKCLLWGTKWQILTIHKPRHLFDASDGVLFMIFSEMLIGMTQQEDKLVFSWQLWYPCGMNKYKCKDTKCETFLLEYLLFSPLLFQLSRRDSLTVNFQLSTKLQLISLLYVTNY